MNIDSINSVSDLGSSSFSSTAKADSVQTDDFAKQLEAAKNKKDTQSMKKVCKDFESIFLNMILKNMRSTVPQDSLFDDSSSIDTFQGMLDEQYADAMSKKGIGLADMMYKQLSRETGLSTDGTSKKLNTKI